MKNLIVQKYGGTSVGSIEKIKKIAKDIVNIKNSGKRIVVVLSAMGDTTDILINKAKSINQNPSKRELDMLLSTGEQVSISLMAMALESLNESVISLTGFQCKILANEKLRITKIDSARIKKELNNNKIVIVAGFQGVTENNDITTLGRGGSDTTAVALANALNAEKCEIYTDVDGVYTSDPRKVSDAKLLDKISYDEMLELASLGAKVLHPRSVELARNYNIPLVVKPSHKKGNGTKIMEVNQVEKVVVRGISLDENTAKITVLEVPDKPGIAFKLFKALAKSNIQIDMIIQNINKDSVNDISFTIKRDYLEKSINLCKKIAKGLGAKDVIYDDTVAKLSVVGTGLAGNSEVASTFFEGLYEQDINIEMISTSEIKISCIIDRKKGVDALQHLHNRFELAGY
ncbi:MAG: aspartate kinase [Firmicutes bacterium]|nr:aspartate kinase [Bacillota bacterium]